VRIGSRNGLQKMIDSHCHLAGEEFAADLGPVVDRAREAGVLGALVILAAGDDAEAARARSVQSAWEGARFSVGIHPHHAADHAADLDAAIARLDRDLTAQGAIALGEIGLDYHYDLSPRDLQQEVFRRQLRLARSRDLPVIIHTREAAEDTFRLLREDGAGCRVVFHCFTGGIELATSALDAGGLLSFAGILTFPKAAELRKVAQMVPADRFLVETDSPYLAPVPFRGKRNEPAFVAKVVEALATVRGTAPARVADQSTANFQRVFRAAGHV
jgi:TatD DNase family protein